MKLFLFRDKKSNRYLGKDAVTHKYDLFDPLYEQDLMDRLEYSFDKEQAEFWLEWFLKYGTINKLIEEELIEVLKDVAIEVVPFEMA